MNDDQQPTVQLPPLPPDLHDELLSILFGDPLQRARDIEALLARSAEHKTALAAHVAYHDRERAALAPHADAIPGYRLLRTLGEGGMGIVYLADQLVPLRRQVAVKVIKQGMDSREVLERFERERQALARMDHEAIAKVYDCGATSRGQPFFAMEHVDGQPLDRFADEQRLSLRGRIELFLQVCRGVQHAHQKGVIHRDLKPGNVLVGERDGQPIAKVIDFGIARAIVRDTIDDTLRTEVGQMVGTPEYMSPEQADGDAARVDTRTDVYSLGAMLYELVSGALPFTSGRHRSIALAELRRHLQDDELPRPSTRLHGLGELATLYAERRRLTVTSLQRELRGDLDWIVLRAMARQPEHRYPSAIALADDLQRYLDGMPVLAGPPSALYRLRKFSRRHRAPLTFATFVLIAVLGGLVGTGVALARVKRSNQRFDLISHVVELRTAKTTAASIALRPAWPAQVAELEVWLATYAEPLPRQVPAVRAAVTEITAGEPVGDLNATTSEFLRGQLSTFLDEIGAFEQHEVAELRARRQWASRLEAATLHHPQAKHNWQQARDAIRAADGVTASALYAASPIDLEPQDGLVPLGMNPVTKLWEFYDLRSAADLAGDVDPSALDLPTLADDGSITAGETTGIVFVLLPGGTFHFSAQKDDAASANYDPDMPTGGRTFEVTLAPFFLARHELTQGQWRRLAGAPAPCYHKPGDFADGMPAPITLAHPVENVSWGECDALLRQHGMLLPTEAQWEYACRAGQGTPWCFGNEVDTLRSRANLLDQRAKHYVPSWPPGEVPWDDGYILHAPVGSFAANGFGLYDVHGNVSEWCRDGIVGREPTFAPGDGLQLAPGDEPKHAYRGGSFLTPAPGARCAWRSPEGSAYRQHDQGCRASRALLPATGKSGLGR